MCKYFVIDDRDKKALRITNGFLKKKKSQLGERPHCISFV